MNLLICFLVANVFSRVQSGSTVDYSQGCNSLIENLFKYQMKEMEDRMNLRLDEQADSINQLKDKVAEQDRIIHQLRTQLEAFELQQKEQKNNSDNLLKIVDSTVQMANLRILSTQDRMPRTCNEIKSLNTLASSGNYIIDPDGTGVGEDPISVYCNMTAGTTEIGHDSENPIEVVRCAPAGCYRRNITYKHSMKQIKALVDLSQSCKQRIQYECAAAPFEFRDIAYAWWTDRHGQKQIYWTGMNSGYGHTCQCGIDGNCVDTATKCNCDSGSPDMLQDEGYLSDMTKLPVTALHFGRILFSSSKGTHTLGRLECSGKHQVSKIPSSCEDIWRSGNTVSGIFHVINKTLQAVYCDFAKRLSDPGFQVNLMQQQDNDSGNRLGTIAFSAYTKASFGSKSGTIPFERVILNLGNAYHTNGTFITPYPGLYFFSYKGVQTSTQSTPISLLINDQKYRSLSGITQRDPATTVGILELKSGDQVSVHFDRNEWDQYYGRNRNVPNNDNHFKGYLITAFSYKTTER